MLGRPLDAHSHLWRRAQPQQVNESICSHLSCFRDHLFASVVNVAPSLVLIFWSRNATMKQSPSCLLWANGKLMNHPEIANAIHIWRSYQSLSASVLQLCFVIESWSFKHGITNLWNFAMYLELKWSKNVKLTLWEELNGGSYVKLENCMVESEFPWVVASFVFNIISISLCFIARWRRCHM